MAEANYTATTPELEYNLCPWGDLIYGTKEQLQAIGLGIGIPFPSEAGETRKKIKVSDPRGFTAFINYASYKGDGVFCAIIKFPERDSPEPKWRPFTFGVKKREAIWGDDFIGTGEALSAAGLVQINQLPGQPGMRKVCVTIHPDGTIKTDNKTRREGDKTIKKSGKTATRWKLKSRTRKAKGGCALITRNVTSGKSEWPHYPGRNRFTLAAKKPNHKNRNTSAFLLRKTSGIMH